MVAEEDVAHARALHRAPVRRVAADVRTATQRGELGDARLAREQRRAREAPRAAPCAQRAAARVGHADTEQLALRALALLAVPLGLALLLGPLLASPPLAARRVRARLRLLLAHDERLVALVDDDALPCEPLERHALVGALEALSTQLLQRCGVARSEERGLVAVLLPRAALAEGVLARVGHPHARERVWLGADEPGRAASLKEGGKRVASRLGHEVLLVGALALLLRLVVEQLAADDHEVRRAQRRR